MRRSWVTAVWIGLALFALCFALQAWILDNESPALLAAIPAVIIGAGWGIQTADAFPAEARGFVVSTSLSTVPPSSTTCFRADSPGLREKPVDPSVGAPRREHRHWEGKTDRRDRGALIRGNLPHGQVAHHGISSGARREPHPRLLHSAAFSRIALSSSGLSNMMSCPQSTE